jgi:Rrf2 family protein
MSRHAEPSRSHTVCRVRVSAKVDYALRAMLELAAASGLVKAEQLATSQAIPRKFLENILLELRHAELVTSQRGVEGGYTLAREADAISVADVIRAVEGPIATVRGSRPEEIEYTGSAAALQSLWLELRTAMRDVLEQATLAELVAGSEQSPVDMSD